MNMIQAVLKITVQCIINWQMRWLLITLGDPREGHFWLLQWWKIESSLKRWVGVIQGKCQERWKDISSRQDSLREETEWRSRTDVWEKFEAILCCWWAEWQAHSLLKGEDLSLRKCGTVVKTIFLGLGVKQSYVYNPGSASSQLCKLGQMMSLLYVSAYESAKSRL